MKKTQGRYSALSRVLAFLLAFVMVAGYLPTTNVWTASAAELTPGSIETVADPETLTRPTDIYGNHTLNAGKVTVGKSVATHGQTVKLGTNGKFPFTAKKNNFTVTISQFAQVMGLSSETSVPVDVVFVLDTSGSMEGDRARSMVNAANSAIKTLMEANKDNRVSVVAFSSAAAQWNGTWRDWGQGTSDGAAANVLSPLAHYDDNTATATTADDAASNHLRWANSSGTASSNGAYLLGRGSGNVSAGYRRGNHEDAGGTNIHAGIALGAQQLMNVTDTTVTYENGTTVTRMPFIIVLSDGAPTFASSSTNWYSPSQKDQNGDGSNGYTGNGFLAALTAAYYKGAITNKYFGSAADNNNRCNIYTIGVSVGSDTLANLTLNPKENFNANATGSNHSGRFTSYWNSYNRNNLINGFTVEVNDDQNFRITNTSISTTKNFVTGKNANGAVMYSEGAGITYNDGYYSATQTSQIAGIFQTIVTEISKKAISSPTYVSGNGENFSGYVHFSDPIGEYMEVKDMKGLVIGDYFYQGASFAEMLKNYGKGGTDQNEFDALLRSVLDERMKLSGSTVDEATFIQNALQFENQAYYNSPTDFDNSLVWWGSDYVSGNGEQLQVLGNAEDDTIAFIESAKAHDADPNNAGSKIIPAGAKYVCRSYFFYGEAGGTNPDPNHEMMYFMVRVQRSLDAPYQQTVVISCPASLLSVEKVLITEESDGTYTASVAKADPARVVYEVGLRGDINAQNVDQIVNDTYKNETVTGSGSVNYDKETGTYHFFTNDWDRTQRQDSHHRAMTEATFEAAADNSFYTYQQDTLIVNDRGEAVTSDPKGTTAYYVRTYYEWGNTADANGDYAATPKTKLIKVDIPSNANLVQKDGKWYIPKGTYTASTLQTNGDDVIKGDDPNTTAVEKNNVTGTSEIVSHAHRTNSATDNHYTVKLGNNGMLTIVSDPAKSVTIGDSQEDGNGKTVMVGDELTYTIKAVNSESSAAKIVITDTVPTGTELVENSITNDGKLSTDGKTITWTFENVEAGGNCVVSFKVKVLQDALAGEQNVQNITNTGTIQIGNNPAYTTNTTTNPPEGKKVVGEGGSVLGDVQVGDVLTYRIRYYNDTDATATITVTDIVPKGTTFISATHNGQQISEGADEGYVVWVIENVEPGKSGVVSFDVKVDASAKQSANATQLGEGEITITNNATITIGENGPTQTTNTTKTKVKTGNVAVKKTVTNADKQTQSFKIQLSESTGKLNGTYLLSSNPTATTTEVTFTNGVSEELEIKHNQTLTVHGLPAGTTIYVQETGLDNMPGWSAVYKDDDDGNDPQRVIVDAEQLKTFTIENTYRVTPVTFQLKGTKTFTGANFPAGRFTFRAQLTDENGDVKTGNDALSVTAIIDHTGGTATNVEFKFSPREFTEVETRYYLIDESAVSIPGVTTSTKQYLLKLDIVDEDAELVVKAYIKSRDDSTTAWKSISWSDFNWANTTVDFTNTYKPAETSLTLSGTKKLNGRVMSDNEFGFELVEIVNGNEVPVSAALVKASNTDAHDGTFSFDPITYKAEGTHTYIIREIKGNNDRITYDDDYYKVTVFVADNQGQLNANITAITKHSGPSDSTGTVQTLSNTFKYAFENTFTPADVSVSLSGNKILTGEAAKVLNAEDFTFVVYEATAEYVADTSKIAAGAGNAADDSTQAGLKGAINFSDISYTAAMLRDVEPANGVKTKYFYYVAKEVIPASSEPSYDRNMKYDTTEYQIKVEVVHDLNAGALTAKIVEVSKKVDVTVTPLVTNGTSDSYNSLDFANIKNPATVVYRPVGKKTINGTGENTGLRFSFRVRAMGTSSTSLVTNGPIEATGVSQGQTNTGDVIDFTALTFDADDVGETFYYLIEEVSAAGNMVKYDIAQYVLAVIVGRNEDTNALTVTPVYYKVAQETKVENEEAVTVNKIATDMDNWMAEIQAGVKYGSADFTNDFDAHATLNITATKWLNSDKRDLQANEFDFRLQLLTKVINGESVTYQLPENAPVVDGINSGEVNDNKNTIHFGTLIFTDEQMKADYKVSESTENATKIHTYQYKALMSEIVPDGARIPGVSYDPKQYIVTIEWTATIPQDITDPSRYSYGTPKIIDVRLANESDGAYTAVGENLYDSTKGNDTGITFENTYAPTSTSVTIEATKMLDGRDLKKGEFAFELYREVVAADGSKTLTLVETATNGDGGLVTFTRNYPSSISAGYFTTDSENDGYKEATFTYVLKEVRTNKGGVTYSGNEYTIKVVVEHNTKTAALSVESVTYYDKNGTQIADGNDEGDKVDKGEIVFTNTYKSTTTYYTPVADKLLLGANDKALELGDNLYSFEIVELTKNGDTWTAGTTPVSIGANAANNLPSTEKGAVVFSPISYSHRTVNQNPHTHYYEIREVKGSLSGVTYDTTKYYMAVEVYDDQAGKLYVLNAKYYKGEDAAAAFASRPVYTEVINELINDTVTPATGDPEGTKITFTNHYGPGYVNINLELGKVMKLHNTSEYDMTDSQFDFTVSTTDGDYVTSGSNMDDGDTDLLKDKIVFGSITVTQAADYIYMIKEDVPSDADVKGIQVDSKIIYAHVHVEADGYGNFSYTVSYRDSDQWMQGNEIEGKFTNTYTAKPVDFYIVAHKHLTGKQLADKEFEFELYDQEPTEGVQPIKTTTNNAAGEVVFQMKYEHTGTYTYWLKEAGTGTGATGAGEYKLDPTIYKIEVVVADDTAGNLYVKSAEKEKWTPAATLSLRATGLTHITGMEFYNTFTPSGIAVNLNQEIDGEKIVVDAEGNIREDLTAGFEFQVLDIQNKPAFTDDEGKEVYAKSNAQGQIEMPMFEFSQAGEYHYWIFERNAAAPFTKDSAIYEIHILVRQNASAEPLELKDENGHVMETIAPGALYIVRSEVMTFSYSGTSAQAEGDPTAQSDEDPVVFVNTYEPDPVTITITAGKNLTGRDLKAGEFTFHLTENVNGVDLIRAEATNDADGTVKFTLTYVTDGEHTYSIHEHAPADDKKAGGVTYDTESYGNIKVTVKGENGKLVVTQGNAITSGVTITNKYNAKPVTAVIEASKVLEGGLALKADAFTFQLKDKDGNEVTTAKNDAEGKIQFQIPFNQDMLDKDDAGNRVATTFEYTINEVKGDIPGIVYDENVYKVFVTVTDDLNGNLNYSVTYENAMVPTFRNVYETDDAVVTIKATKKLTGKNLAGDDFEFQLKDEAGNVVKTVKNDAQGNIVFQIALDEAKDYTFTIVEVAHADKHYSHDNRTYKVTVKVKDNGEGKLIAEDPVYEKTPVFENTYSPDSIYVTVEASKTLSGGKALKADAFEFQLLVKDEVVDTAKNGADGKIKFEIPYEFKDLGGEAEKTFTYTMVEKAGNNPDRYDYDSNKYTVTVKLVNDNGVLKATVTYGTTDGKAPVFKNTWKPEKIGISLTGTKTLTGRDMKAGEFKFQVHDSTDTLVATGTNDAKGKITFTPVGIVTKGTYLLTVSEVKGSAEYVTYDKTTFQVKVVVENVDGVLTPTVTYLDGDIAFENSYDEPANPETGDNAPIYWMIGLLVVSALAIVLLIVLRPKKGGKYAK